jgi:aminomethyltransferase
LGKWCKLDGEHDFLAKAALRRIQEEGAREALVGLQLAAGEPLPSVVKPMPITDASGAVIGTLRASAWSPRLNKNIALGRIASGHSTLGSTVKADVGTGVIEATVVGVPFA